MEWKTFNCTLTVLVRSEMEKRTQRAGGGKESKGRGRERRWRSLQLFSCHGILMNHLLIHNAVIKIIYDATVKHIIDNFVFIREVALPESYVFFSSSFPVSILVKYRKTRGPHSLDWPCGYQAVFELFCMIVCIMQWLMVWLIKLISNCSSIASLSAIQTRLAIPPSHNTHIS